MRADVSGSVPPSLKKETGHLKVLYNEIFGCMKEVLDRSDVVDHDLDR